MTWAARILGLVLSVVTEDVTDASKVCWDSNLGLCYLAATLLILSHVSKDLWLATP